MRQRIVFAIKGCNRDLTNGVSQAVRDTWGRDVQAADAQLLFFVGHGSGPTQPDVVRLPCGDSYEDLSHKTKAICKWLAENKQTEIAGAYLCDNDTFLVPELVQQRIEKAEYADYYGRIWKDYRVGLVFPNYRDCRHVLIERCYPWASGGVGYFLSVKAMRIIARTNVDHWAEDLWVGQVMGRDAECGEVTIANDMELDGGAAMHSALGIGTGQAKYTPDWMRNHHQTYKATGKIEW